MEIRIGYRIVEYKDDKFMSLFHGTQHSRIIHIGRWNKADSKMVTDGSNTKEYLSGYHYFPDMKDAFAFFNRLKIKENRSVVRVQVRGDLRPKPSNPKVWLADEMMIIRFWDR